MATVKKEGERINQFITAPEVLFVRLSIMVSINLIFRRRVKKLRKSKS